MIWAFWYARLYVGCSHHARVSYLEACVTVQLDTQESDSIGTRQTIIIQ